MSNMTVGEIACLAHGVWLGIEAQRARGLTVEAERTALGKKPVAREKRRSLPYAAKSELLLPADLGSYERAITVHELANVIGVSSQMVFERAANGSLPCFRICSAIRFCPITIANHLAWPLSGLVPGIVERLIARGPSLDVVELANLLHVSPKTIMKATKKQGLPCLRIGARVMFSGRAVARHFQEVGGYKKFLLPPPKIQPKSALTTSTLRQGRGDTK